MMIAGAVSYTDALKILALELLEIDQKFKDFASSACNRYECHKLAKKYEHSISQFERQLQLAEDTELKVELIMSFLKELVIFENEFFKMVRR